jgi:hypothetical protein
MERDTGLEPGIGHGAFTAAMLKGIYVERRDLRK